MLFYISYISFLVLVLFLNLRYVININILILTIYLEFPNLVIIVGKNQV